MTGLCHHQRKARWRSEFCARNSIIDSTLWRLIPKTGNEIKVFKFPAELSIAIDQFNDDRKRSLQALTFPESCRQVLMQDRLLTTREAEEVAALMMDLSNDKGNGDWKRNGCLHLRLESAVLLTLAGA